MYHSRGERPVVNVLRIRKIAKFLKVSRKCHHANEVLFILINRIMSRHITMTAFWVISVSLLTDFLFWNCACYIKSRQELLKSSFALRMIIRILSSSM